MRETLALLVVLAGACTDSEAPEDPWFEVLLNNHGDWQQLEEGIDCPVIYGRQSGYWVMPMLYATGLGETPAVRCAVVDTDTDMVLGDSSGVKLFVDSDEGPWREHIFLLGLWSIGTPEMYRAIDGHNGHMSCVADPKGLALTREANVVIRAVTQ